MPLCGGYLLVYYINNTLVRSSRGTKGTGFDPRDVHPHFSPFFPLFLIISLISFSFFFFLFSSMGNYQSPLKRAFEGGFNGDAADSTGFFVVNCIANRSAKSFSRRESEKFNKLQKFLRVLASM